YTMMIQANKRVNSRRISSRELIGTIDTKDINKLKNFTQSILLERRQRWTCNLLNELERKELIPAGTSAYYRARIEPRPHKTCT
ncbi:hypothetical protein K458DRAFT_303217, partial [Lentithecium fluviatile CBS 122367]